MLRAQERIAAEWEGYLPGVREAADRAEEEREDKVGAWERLLLLLSAVLTLLSVETIVRAISYSRCCKNNSRRFMAFLMPFSHYLSASLLAL